MVFYSLTSDIKFNFGVVKFLLCDISSSVDVLGIFGTALNVHIYYH